MANFALTELKKIDFETRIDNSSLRSQVELRKLEPWFRSLFREVFENIEFNEQDKQTISRILKNRKIKLETSYQDYVS